MTMTFNNLCDSCSNIGCEFQSGIVRTKCAFYMPPHIEPDNCGNYVVQQEPTDRIEYGTDGNAYKLWISNGKEYDPSGDLISRQAVQDAFWKLDIELRPSAIDAILNMVNGMPSVKQEPKEGHWIVHPKGVYAHLVCDKCLSNAPYDCRTNYCPNCGAKMESEEAE